MNINPPAQYDFPFAVGYTSQHDSYYWKSENGIAGLVFSVKQTEGNMPLGVNAIGTLPVGVRPSRTVNFSGTSFSASGTPFRQALSAIILPSGEIEVNINVASTHCTACVVFLAT